MKIKFQREHAFTLAEMAIVVVIFGIVVSMGLKLGVAKLNNAAYSDTVSKQARIKIALINYPRAKRELPCPETQTLPANAAYGLEARVAAPQDGACNAVAAGAIPVVPWVTLGLSRDDVVDGWGNFFTYRVASIATDRVNWTSQSTANPAAFTINELAYPTQNVMTIKQGDGINPLVTVTSQAVVAIISHGKNGFGARTIKGQLNVAPTGADELVNARPYATVPAVFIIRPATDNVAALGGAYDDIVAYMTPQDLLQPLASEGTLLACRSYCLSSSSCTGVGTPYSFCTGAGAPPTPPARCTAANTPYSYCTGPGRPIAPEAACTGLGNPYSFCTGPGAPAVPFSGCTGVGTPYQFCTNPGTPAIPTTTCTGPRTPYSFCTFGNTPPLACLATNTPVGNPVTVCP